MPRVKVVKQQKKQASRIAIPGKLRQVDVKGWIWPYFSETIKVFVPKQFKSYFQVFLKSHKQIKARQCAIYTLSTSKIKIKNAPQTYRLREGKDYIINSQYNKVLQEWLKGAIKEYNDDIISIKNDKKTN